MRRKAIEITRQEIERIDSEVNELKERRRKLSSHLATLRAEERDEQKELIMNAKYADVLGRVLSGEKVGAIAVEKGVTPSTMSQIVKHQFAKTYPEMYAERARGSNVPIYHFYHRMKQQFNTQDNESDLDSYQEYVKLRDELLGVEGSCHRD